jgi:hypothetical protein
MWQMSSPEERAVATLLSRAIARARILAVVRTIAWAICGAAVGAEAAVFGRAPIAAVASAVAAAAALICIRRTSTARAHIVASLERAEPAYRNLLVTASELSEHAYVSDSMRARVFADAAAVSDRVELKRALPTAAAWRTAAVAAALWSIVAVTMLAVGRAPIVQKIARPRGDGATSRDAKSSLRITVTIDPPPYTGIAATTEVDPLELRAIEGSRLTLRIDSDAARVQLTHDGAARTIDRDVRGTLAARETLLRTGYLVVDAGSGGQRTIPVVVTPDALPAVRITAPGRDLVFAGGNPRLTFDAEATDDFGLRSLALHYTKVSGSGEQFAFAEGEIPLAIDRASARQWRGTAARVLADLSLKEGDMLVYRAVASDARPGSPPASSDVFYIEVSKLGAAAGDSFTLPQEETRYALSEQMLIMKTERLNGRRGSMAAADVQEASIDLGVEQRMIRAEFVFMLGGEVEDEEVEAEQSTELQEGRLENYGQRDIRAATIAMSQAEKQLTAANTADALKAERAAVAALQRAFARGRYILRALATRSQLDLSRRLTGTLSEAVDWRRRLVERPHDRRAAGLQDLLRGIAGLIADAAIDTDAVRPRAAVLAEQAIRSDASSSALRTAATSLQRIADAWRTLDPAERARRLTAISVGIAAEMRRALGTAAAFDRPAATLGGAFADRLDGSQAHR